MIPSSNIDDQRILQSDWTKAFWPITCEPELFQIRGFHRNIESNKFLQQKIMKKFSHNSKKPVWAHFRKNTNFPKKERALSLLSPYDCLTLCTISKKTSKQLPRKECYGWMNRRTSRQTDGETNERRYRWPDVNS